ncbi:MAG: histidinol-phosphatase HisJ family protein [Coriobacteriales bacterium]|jgi:histidinol-phosphatase (PHP family)|nr:histidinol-phosphatase HisJ family protein [Coriobacteriales bacterium]
MEKTDCHTHTYLSNHGTGTVNEVVAAACAQGLTTIAITEHLPLPKSVNTDGSFAMDADKLGFYLQEVEAARAAYPQIEVICGTEVDWREGAEDYILNLLASHGSPFELVLGSVHMLSEADGSHWEFDHPDFISGWEECGEEQVWQRYFELWRDAVRSVVPFQLMTHPDLPKKLGFKPKFDARELYQAMATEAAKAGVMVEVNTSGLHKPVRELYPTQALLEAFCAAKVDCTVSSDAHCPADVGRDLDKGYHAMMLAGYTHVTVPTRSGDRRKIELL